MKRKPWPILALAIFQWISPIGDWLISSWVSKLSPFAYLMFLTSHQGVWLYLLDAWLPAVIAGIAVYRVKPWSYPVFVCCILYTSFRSAGNSLQAYGQNPV